MATTESRSRPTSTSPNPGSRSHSALSPSPARQQPSPHRRPTVGPVSVFAAKNKLRKSHPLASTNTFHDDPATIKSTLESESSSSAASTPPSRQSPVNNAEANPPIPSTLVDEAQRIPRRASPGFVLARPNSSLSLLKPNATKAQKVRGLRGANRAIKMKIIRAFSRLFSVTSAKTRGGQSNGRTEAPVTQKEPRFVRLFIPRRFLLRADKKLDGKGKERQDVSNVDGRKDSKLALDSPDKITFTETRHHSGSPTESIVLEQAHAGEGSPKHKGILRVRLKKDEQQNGHAKESNGTVSPSGKPGLPPGVLVVEDPVWSARKKSLNNYNRDPYTPPRTPTLDAVKESADSPPPRVAAKGKDQKPGARKGRKPENPKQKEQAQFLQVPISATPPPQVRTPPNEIGLALTTDDVSIISEISRASSVAVGQLTPNYLPIYDGGEEKRLSWMIPNNLTAEELGRSTHRSSLLQEPPASADTTVRVVTDKLRLENSQRRVSSSRTSTSSTIVTPTRIVTSPTSQLRRSPNGDFDELVEFNVLVRPGDALYDILVQQEQQMAVGDGEDLEIESEIEYFTADEDESADISEDERGYGDEDDRDSVASGTGTIRAVEIASEGGTMRGVEIVGKRTREKRHSGAGSADNWGFADVLVGSRR